MTKSGIGTAIANGSNTSAPATPAATTTTTTTTTTTNSTANAEIPIWIADKKKWVTGISKKTTINDLIYAILKQCQLVQATSSSDPLYHQQYAQIMNNFVLVEYIYENAQASNGDAPKHQHHHHHHHHSINTDIPPLTYPAILQPNMSLASQRILNGDTKVYKYIGKWSQYSTASSSSSSHHQHQHHNSAPNVNNLNSNNLILKILQRGNNNANENSEQQQQQQQQQNEPVSNGTHTVNNHHSSTSLASKLLKKFGVSSNSNNPNLATTTATNKSSITSSVSSPQIATIVSSQQFKFLDVKLPNQSNNNHQSQPNLATTQLSIATQKHQPSQQQQYLQPTNANNGNHNISPASSSSLTNSSGGILPAHIRGFEPNVQKSFLFNTIVEKDNQLKHQIEKFQLLDELIKETEKKAKTTIQSGCSAMNTGGGVPTTKELSQPQANGAVSLVDLNDIYCHFPEMCTHHLKEVEDFTNMCCQLFQLDEAIHSQKETLAKLESELQRELNQNNTAPTAANSTSAATTTNNLATGSGMVSDTPETIELRKEVNMSREQTRLQCKQLHDLDLRMRQNEQSLLLKEQQLQQLLEELYYQEVCSDSQQMNNNSANLAMNGKSNHLTVRNNNNSADFSNEFINLNDSAANHNYLAHEQQQKQQQIKNDFQDDTVGLLNQSIGAVEQTTKPPSSSSMMMMNRPVELMIKNELNNFNNRRQVRLFGDSNDDMFAPQQPMIQRQAQQFSQRSNSNNSTSKTNFQLLANQTTAPSAPIQPQQPSMNQAQRSFSYSNLAATNSNGAMNPSSSSSSSTASSTPPTNTNAINNNIQIPIHQHQHQHQKTNGISLNIAKSPFESQHPPAQSNNYNPQSIYMQNNATAAKSIKMANGGLANNNNNNTDHSGDNDSGISSMSSETTAAMIATASSTISTFHHQQQQMPTSISQQTFAKQQLISPNYSQHQQQQSRQMPFVNCQPYNHHHLHHHNQQQQQMMNMHQNSYFSSSQQQPTSQQQQVIAITPNGTKSMLETLV